MVLSINRCKLDLDVFLLVWEYQQAPCLLSCKKTGFSALAHLHVGIYTYEIQIDLTFPPASTGTQDRNYSQAVRVSAKGKSTALS